MNNNILFYIRTVHVGIGICDTGCILLLADFLLQSYNTYIYMYNVFYTTAVHGRKCNVSEKAGWSDTRAFWFGFRLPKAVLF